MMMEITLLYGTVVRVGGCYHDDGDNVTFNYIAQLTIVMIMEITLLYSTVLWVGGCYHDDGDNAAIDYDDGDIVTLDRDDGDAAALYSSMLNESEVMVVMEITPLCIAGMELHAQTSTFYVTLLWAFKKCWKTQGDIYAALLNTPSTPNIMVPVLCHLPPTPVFISLQVTSHLSPGNLLTSLSR